MPNSDWAEEAVQRLKSGQKVQVRIQGDLMLGRINDGDFVIIQPRRAPAFQIGDIVLARIQTGLFFGVGLHQIMGNVEVNYLEVKYLLGNERGWRNGWVAGKDIFGVVTDIHPNSRATTFHFSQEKEDAEFYRLALLADLCTADEIIAWCDSIIATSPTPDIAIIEASMEGSGSQRALTEALKKVAGSCDYNRVAHRLFAPMLATLRQDHGEIRNITAKVRLLFDEGTCPFCLDEDVKPFSEEFSWDAKNDYDRPTTVADVVIEFLEMQLEMTRPTASENSAETFPLD